MAKKRASNSAGRGGRRAAGGKTRSAKRGAAKSVQRSKATKRPKAQQTKRSKAQKPQRPAAQQPKRKPAFNAKKDSAYDPAWVAPVWNDGVLLGAHVSAAGGTAQAPPRARAIGATAMQLFTKMANRWAERACEP